MSFKGFRKFVKDTIAGRTIAVTALGLALPAMSMYVAARTNLGNLVAKVPVLGTVMGNAYGRAAIGSVLTGALSYGLMSLGMLGRNEAIAANTIALTLFLVNAMKQSGHLPGIITNALPMSVDDSGLFGYGGGYYLNGGSSYLGYLGEAHEDEEPAGELFGYSAAPAVNVF